MIKINQLKSLYKDAFADDPSKISGPHNYDWFKTTDGQVFGIKSTRLSKNEQQLLNLSFSHYEPKSLNRTKKQQFWANLIFNHPSDLATSPAQSVHLVYIHLNKFPEQQINLETAIHSYFDRSYITTIWRTSDEGIILLKKELVYTCEDLVHLIISDFYCDPYMLHVPYAEVSALPELYKNHFSLLNTARQVFPERHEFQYMHLLPIMLILASQKSESADLSPWSAKLSKIPHDLLDSVTIFFRHNFNLSTAANELFLHRNTLNYRLDRFRQLTGLDPKHFEDAVIISLLVYLHRYEQRCK
ncbi:MAG: helix-turn-helix domain-containing protein [Sporolactobacillus sp.]